MAMICGQMALVQTVSAAQGTGLKVVPALAGTPSVGSPARNGERAPAYGKLKIKEFNDLNGNGVQDPGEPGLPGWTFTINTPKPTLSGPTNSKGIVTVDLLAGAYTVTETPQTGWTQTKPAGGSPQGVTVSFGKTANISFGDHQISGPGTVCVKKFNDLNGNGIRDTDERFMAWPFTITNSNGVATAFRSAVAERDCFSTSAGNYTIAETPQPGWTQTTPTPVGPRTVTVTAGQTTTVIFGNHQGGLTGSLCIAEFDDLNGNGVRESSEPLLSGWVITVVGANGSPITTTTSANKNCLLNLPVGSYTVTETPQPGWTQTTPTPVGPRIVTVTAGQATTVIFGNHQGGLTGSLCIAEFADLNNDGVWSSNEPPLSGWVITVVDRNGKPVSGSPITTTTSTNKNCLFNLPVASYTVTETPQPGWTQTAPLPLGPRTVTVTVGQTTTVIFGNHQGGLTGSLCVAEFADLNNDGVWNPNEPPLSGWVVPVVGANGNPVSGSPITTTTSANKNCLFNLPVGSYMVTEVPQPGWTQTAPLPVGTQTIAVTAGQTTVVVFGNRLVPVVPATGTLCIRNFNDLNANGLKNTKEAYLAGWKFTIANTIAGQPNYGLTTTNLQPDCLTLPVGTYLVAETVKTGWTQTRPYPAYARAVTITVGGTSTLLFGSHKGPLGTLCVNTFNDLNGNGKKDSGEPYMIGWKFVVTGPTPLKIAIGGDPRLSCRPVLPGSYAVTEIARTGWVQTAPKFIRPRTVVVKAGILKTALFGDIRRPS